MLTLRNTALAATLLLLAACGGDDAQPASIPGGDDTPDAATTAEPDAGETTAPDVDASADAGTDTGGGGADNAPYLRVTPTDVVFDVVAEGEVAEATITLESVGYRAVTIESITLVETTLDDEGGQELELAEEAPADLVLQPGESTTVVVRHRPADQDADSGRLEIAADDTRGDHVVRLSSPALHPDLDCLAEIDLGEVASGESKWVTFAASNGGDVAVTLTDVVIDPAEAGFRVSYPYANEPSNPPSSDATTFEPLLPAGGQLWIRLWYDAADTEPAEAGLRLHSDDPDSPCVSRLLANQ